MLLLLRRLKHGLFMNKEFRTYLAYAFGELLLVVIGILLALQIDNWNEDRKERATLQSYLESIAGNMREDLDELKPLRELSTERLYLASRFDALRGQNRFTVDEIFFFNRVWSVASTQSYFSPNTSGFEALKSSGVLNRLQGSDLERLLSAYYDNVNQVGMLQASMDAYVSPLLSELRQAQPRELEPYEVINPSAVPPDRFQAAQPLYAELINSPTTSALVDSQFGSFGLVQHYDNLSVLGEAFIRAAKSGQLNLPGGLPHTPTDDYADRLATPDFVIDGRPLAESYWFTVTTPPGGASVFRLGSIQRHEGALHIDYPGGAEWAVVYWGVMATGELDGRTYQDFSRFSKLHLELKGDRGGEVLKVHVKDKDYSDDISPVSVDVTLSDEWQTFEIDLAEFAPNDLSRLHVPLGLLIFPAEEPMAFSIRNARYQ